MCLKKVSIGMGFILFMLFIVGCQSQKDVKSDIKLGFVVSTLDNPFFISLKDGAQSEADRLGATLLLRSSENSHKTEFEAIQELIEIGVDCLIINPTDSDAVYESIRYANLKNIPVITVDRNSTGGQVVCHIASNNELGGALAADFIIDSCKNDGKYAEMKGLEGTSAAIMRGKGFNDQMIAKGNMTLAAVVSASFDREEGKKIMNELLNVHPNLKALFAQNDEMALGALEAANSLNKQVIIVGFDGTSEAIKAVNEGRMAATVAQQPDLIGSEAVKQSLRYLKGDKVENMILIDVKLVKKL